MMNFSPSNGLMQKYLQGSQVPTPQSNPMANTGGIKPQMPQGGMTGGIKPPPPMGGTGGIKPDMNNPMMNTGGPKIDVGAGINPGMSRGYGGGMPSASGMPIQSHVPQPMSYQQMLLGVPGFQGAPGQLSPLGQAYMANKNQLGQWNG